MDLMRYDSPVMTFFRKTGGVVILNFLFLLGCLPVITAGTSLCALYYAAQKNLSHDRSYPWTAFLDCFRQNLRQTVPIGCGLLGIFALFAADSRLFWGFLENGNAVGRLYLLCLFVDALVIVYSVWVFALIARFQNTVRRVLKNAALLMMRHLLVSIVILAMIVVFGMLMYLLPLTVMICPALMVWLMSLSLEKVFAMYMNEEQKQAESERNREYGK